MAPTEELHWQKWPPELLSRLDATGVGWQPEVNGRRRYPVRASAGVSAAIETGLSAVLVCGTPAPTHLLKQGLNSAALLFSV
jgi:hypothetical protein